VGSRPGEKLAYTVEEAAELLSLSRAKLYRLIDTCELGSVQIGRSRRITLAQLHQFLKQLETRDESESLRLRKPIRQQGRNSGG